MEDMKDPEFAVDLQTKSIKHLPTAASWRWRAVECTLGTAGKMRFEFNLESVDSGTLSQAIWRYLTQRAYQAVQAKMAETMTEPVKRGPGQLFNQLSTKDTIMPDYKSPATRKAIKNSVKALLMDWVNENLDDSGDTSTAWDDADDSAARTYQDEIDGDQSHAQAMKEARERFYDELKATLNTTLEGVFDSIG
jgi:hypothetical protein